MPKGKDPFAGVGKTLERLPVRETIERGYRKNTRAGTHQAEIPQSVGTGLDLGEKETIQTVTIENKWEIYKKISYIIITQGAAYELPPDWDDTDDSPTWDDGLPDPLDPWFRIERVHEIGYITDTEEILKEFFYYPELTWNLSSGTFNANLVVIETQRDSFVPPANIIPPELLSSSAAVSVIAAARTQV